MSNPVDLTDLRSLTDGDREMELALFQEFYSSSEAGISAMAASCQDGVSESWRSTAHALKGTSYNVGAKALGDLCKQAQENPGLPASEKVALLEKIKNEYARVRAYLQLVHAN